MKKFVCIILSIILFAVSIPTLSAKTTSFKDVPPTAWYNPSVDYCVSKGYFSGTGGNCFSPETNLTREQFVTVLFYFAGYKPSDWQGKTGYGDAENDAWYAPYVRWARILGITSGMGNGEFGIENEITREQFCTLLMNYAKSLGINVSGRANLSSNTDVSEISAWAVDAMSWAVKEGIMSGTSGTTLSPKGITTRAQATMLFMKFDVLVNSSKICKHVYTCSSLKDSNCTESGSVVCRCKKCNKKATLNIKATGHNYIEEAIIPAKCTNGGHYKKTCSLCSDNFEYDVSAKGHNIVNGICQDCYFVSYKSNPAGTRYLCGTVQSDGTPRYFNTAKQYVLTTTSDGGITLTTPQESFSGTWRYNYALETTASFGIYDKGLYQMSMILDTATNEIWIIKGTSTLIFQ